MPCPNPSDIEILQKLAENPEAYLAYEESDQMLTWCDGCGNFGIEQSLFRALALEGIQNQEVLFCFDIGCHGNASDKIGAYTIHGLHGRVLPLAAGAVLANNKMRVIAFAGDGGTFSEGVNHLVHTIRNNYPFLFICHNNENYGLTTGQASSATRKGSIMNSSPDGVLLDAVNVCHFALSLGATFVARTFSGDVKHLTKILQAALHHNGFAFVEVMQLCPTYNKATSQNWFWERIQHIEDIPGYDVKNIDAALAISQDLEKKIAMGILFQREDTNFLEKVPQRKEKKTTLTEEVEYYDIQKFMEEFE
ncbi:2-oxoacid ferredoxin oxidoreductase [Candidatus Peregrinibacteria bacterium]|nr:2-oxoacid ferredoxin oxidoreductase [Candidatus Peregrinibacteria bacterium]